MAHRSGNPFCGALIFFLVGLGMMYGGMQRYLLVQKIKNTPTSKVDAAAVGLVELAGKARCMEPEALKRIMEASAPKMTPNMANALDKASVTTQVTTIQNALLIATANSVSPISKVKCVYWRIVGEYYRSGKHGGWRNIYKASSYTQFYLADDSGKMLIDPKDAEVDIPQDRLYQGYISGQGMFGMSHKKMDDAVVEFINGLDIAGKNAFMSHKNQDVRVFEYYIAEDDPLYVLGTAESREGTSSAVGYENLVVRKGKFDKVMYISDTGERAITGKLSGSMYWQIFGGLALSAVCLFIMLITLKV